jgi:hypothetical protein
MAEYGMSDEASIKQVQMKLIKTKKKEQTGARSSRLCRLRPLWVYV